MKASFAIAGVNAKEILDFSFVGDSVGYFLCTKNTAQVLKEAAKESKTKAKPFDFVPLAQDVVENGRIAANLKTPEEYLE